MDSERYVSAIQDVSDEVGPSGPFARTSRHVAPGAVVGPRSPFSTWARRVCRLVSGLLVLALLAQVFLAGLAVFGAPSWWAQHTFFGHLIGLLIVLLLLSSLTARVSGRATLLSGLLVLLMGLQYAFVDSHRWLAGLPIAALHPTNALVMFWVATAVMRAARAGLAGQPSLPSASSTTASP